MDKVQEYQRSHAEPSAGSSCPIVRQGSVTGLGNRIKLIKSSIHHKSDVQICRIDFPLQPCSFIELCNHEGPGIQFQMMTFPKSCKHDFRYVFFSNSHITPSDWDRSTDIVACKREDPSFKTRSSGLRQSNECFCILRVPVLNPRATGAPHSGQPIMAGYYATADSTC
jgi:hypothetical protein